ncbi:MAG TPA: hypothetical protein VEK34_07425 [Methylocella sp.]|nr:hypothetical protein [Methylocella sp.]
MHKITLSALSGAMLLALSAAASAGPMSVASREVVSAPPSAQVEQAAYYYRHPYRYRHYGWYRHRYHRYGWYRHRYYYGWSPAGAAVGTAAALATFPFALAGNAWGYGYPYYGYGYPYYSYGYYPYRWRHYGWYRPYHRYWGHYGYGRHYAYAGGIHTGRSVYHGHRWR